MAVDNRLDYLSDENIDLYSEGGATVLRHEVVGPQATAFSNRRRAAGYRVPTVPTPGDFESTGPFIREGDGVASRLRVNPVFNGDAFPSLGQDDDNGLKAGRAHLGGLVKAQKAYAMNLAARDPQAAGMALADLDGMKDAFSALVNEGWNGKEAAHVVGAVGRVFGGYGNAVENAKQLKRFAATRAVDLQTAGNELWSLQKNFGAGYLTDYGFSGKVTPDSAHYENIRNNFTDLLSAMWKVEDQYDWQFDQATYRDVFNRCRKVAADLDLAGLSVKAVGAEAIVRAALKENGSLNDDSQLNADVSGLMASPARDRELVLLAPGFSSDTAGNPFSVGPSGGTLRERMDAADDSKDFGLLRSLRRELFRHRARSVNSGNGVDDFRDVSALRDDFARSLRAYSTGSANVSDKSLRSVADYMIRSIASGKPVSVVEAAGAVADTVDDAQADALGTWTRGLMMSTAEGDRRLRETVYPFIEEIAASTGLSVKDPAMEPFISQAYSLVRRAFLDRRTVANLDVMTAEMTDDQIWDDVKARLDPQLKRMTTAVAARNEQLAAQAQARKADSL